MSAPNAPVAPEQTRPGFFVVQVVDDADEWVDAAVNRPIGHILSEKLACIIVDDYHDERTLARVIVRYPQTTADNFPEEEVWYAPL